MRSLEAEGTTAAATAVQAHARGLADRRRVQQLASTARLVEEKEEAELRDLAGVKIQAAARGRGVRREASQAREATELAELDEIRARLAPAASRIQAAARGSTVRRGMQRQDDADAVAAANPALHSRLERIESALLRLESAGISRAQTEAEAAAAAAAAAAARELAMEHARREEQRRAATRRAQQATAATSVQAASRGRIARLEVRSRREAVEATQRDGAARTIQAGARGGAARRRAWELARLQAAEEFQLQLRGWSDARARTVAVGPAGRPELKYVPRHAACAAALSVHRVGGGAPAAAADRTGAAPLPASDAVLSTNFGGDAAAPPLSYRCRVLSLQRQQREWARSLPIARPDRVVRLLLQKDEALQSLTQRAADAVQGSGGRARLEDLLATAPGGTSTEPGTSGLNAGLRGLFEAQRAELAQQRLQYESEMRALAAELRRQHATEPQLEQMRTLNASLEQALGRVIELETNATDRAEQLGRAGDVVARPPVRQPPRAAPATAPAVGVAGRQTPTAAESHVCTIS